MQRPAEMTWLTPNCAGTAPTKRSGHTISLVGDSLYIFGGNDFRRPPGPNNELYKLDMSQAQEYYWQKVEPSAGQRWPEPRSHHTAVVFDKTKILLFGGFRSSSIRYNDVWILDTTTDEWSQPHVGITETKADGEVVFKRNWADVPLPRGAHSACLVGDTQLYVFGGYGGSGFARRDFNDITILDLGTWEWRPLECTGELPPARSGHQGVCCIEASSKCESIYVVGGWNSMEQFNDMYILNTVTNEWTRPEENTMGASFGAPRWNHAAVAVFAVPFWKIFVFGGNSGDLSEGTNPQGVYKNDMTVLDTGSMAWSRPTTLGAIPSPRAETQIAYDPKGSRIITFGGWANKWFADLSVCKVADVVGPPYSCNSVDPAFGPITGGTKCTIKGMGFKSVGGTQCTLRFASIKGFAEVSGNVEDDSTITFATPTFEKFGTNVNAECRVAVGGRSLTNSSVKYTYFSVTACEKSLCFGPATLKGCLSAPFPANLIIQARDFSGANRTCGFDKFTITVTSIEVGAGKEGKDIKKLLKDVPVTCQDMENGTYEVAITYPAKGIYEVSIEFDGTFRGSAGHIRGSPYRIDVADGTAEGADAVTNDINGPLVMDHIRKQISDTKDYANRSLNALKKHQRRIQ